MSTRIEGPVRVRFAPSPTGFLHVGGARTAIYNDLLRQHWGGAFILRIEDTDRERSDEAMTRQIQSALAWLGAAWDEGPFLQSERLARHCERGEELLGRGLAYRCFCTQQELEAQRAAAQKRGEAFRYPRTCLALGEAEVAARLAEGRAFAVRFRMPDRHIRFDDLVRGAMDFPPEALDDFIVLRSDGSPTYHMSVVCDDIDMRITHVIRGEDHLSNTPKHIPLFEALGGAVPEFGHLPLILGTDKKRLSKRFGATSVEEFRSEGFLPQALYNYLALLGWTPPGEREILSREELARLFTGERLNASAAVFDREKLTWMNAQYISALPLPELLPHLAPFLAEAGVEMVGAEPEKVLESLEIQAQRGPEVEAGTGGAGATSGGGGSGAGAGAAQAGRVVAAIELHRSRARTLKELAAQVVPYVRAELDYDAEATAKFRQDPTLPAHLKALRERWAGLPAFDKQALEGALRAVAEERGIKAGVLIHPTRTALSGLHVGPPLFDLVEVMGRNATLRHLDRFIGVLAAGEEGIAASPADPAQPAPEDSSDHAGGADDRNRPAPAAADRGAAHRG